MATTLIVADAQTESAIDTRALELFTSSRNLEWDDSLIAALCELRDAVATRRALALIETDSRLSFSLAFKIARTTDRFFDAVEIPARTPAPALLAA